MSTGHLIERHSFNTMSALVDAFVQSAASTLRATLDQHGKASLIVPGGRTPAVYLPPLGQLNLPWQSVSVTLSDERWVDPIHEDSNEKLIRKHFLRHMQMPPHFIPLKTGHIHPEQALEIIDTRLSSLPLPFSLTILGLGEDGHIASLFPGMTLDPDAAGLCQVATPPAAPSVRVSLSFRALINSNRIILIISGKEKRQLIDRLITSPDPEIPFARLAQFKPVELFETD